MGSLFKDDGGLGRFASLAMLGNQPEDYRRRAAECRELATTCLTSDAELILLELAADLDREAGRLGEARAAPVAGGGRY